MTKKKAARMGRPPRHEGQRLSRNRTFRVGGKLDDRLQAAAARSRRSVSEEIEYRLEESFRLDELDGQMKASTGKSFKEALMVPLWEIGRLTTQERLERFFKELLGKLSAQADSSDRTAA